MNPIVKSLCAHGIYISLASLQLLGYLWAANLFIFLSWLIAVMYSFVLIALIVNPTKIFEGLGIEALKAKVLSPFSSFIYVAFFAAQGYFFTAIAWLFIFCSTYFMGVQKKIFLENLTKEES